MKYFVKMIVKHVLVIILIVSYKPDWIINMIIILVNKTISSNSDFHKFNFYVARFTDSQICAGQV